jgi:urease accessory protein
LASVLELLLADSRTPTGGYAHSGGLEAAALPVAEIPSFIAARLRTIGVVEAAFAAAANRAASVDELLRLDAEFAARTPAPPVREASRRLGLALLRCACEWWPRANWVHAYRESSELTPRPVTLGVVARAAALDPGATARLCLYEDAATVAAAAVKLVPVDGAVAAGWLVALAPLINRLARDAAGAISATESPEDLPTTATPSLDIRALEHALDPRRLFAS